MQEVKIMEFEKLIAERYSVRSFVQKHLEKEDIDKILEAGHLAPTGCNFQPQRILVMNTDESIMKLKNCTKCHFDAPCAMLVCYNKNESWVRKYDGALSAPVDASIVTTHMMLAAHNIGVGSCWVMHFDPQAMRENFNIPEEVEPVALLVMGYPAEDAVAHPFHNTFRPIEETVTYETF
jgi:nitroreductase